MNIWYVFRRWVTSGPLAFLLRNCYSYLVISCLFHHSYARFVVISCSRILVICEIMRTRIGITQPPRVNVEGNLARSFFWIIFPKLQLYNIRKLTIEQRANCSLKMSNVFLKYIEADYILARCCIGSYMYMNTCEPACRYFFYFIEFRNFKNVNFT